jgi:hypothetical protein
LNPIRRSLRQDDYTAEELKHGIKGANALREFIFVTIESLVVLAALELALSKQQAVWMWVVYIAAWISLTLYLLAYAKYLINVIAEKFGLAHRNREIFLWAAGSISLIISVGVTHVVPQITAEFINANFMQ